MGRLSTSSLEGEEGPSPHSGYGCFQHQSMRSQVSVICTFTTIYQYYDGSAGSLTSSNTRDPTHSAACRARKVDKDLPNAYRFKMFGPGHGTRTLHYSP